MKYPIRPGILLVSPHAELLWKGEKKKIIKSKRFDKYNRNPIYWFDNDNVYGTLILGEPSGPLNREEAKKVEGAKITEEEFEKWWSEGDEFWVWTPRVLMRFKTPKKHQKWEGVETFKRQIAVIDEKEMAEYDPPYAPVPTSGKNLGDPIKLNDVLEGGFKPIVLQRDFIVLTGGVVNQGETRGDVDMIVRAPENEFYDMTIHFRLSRYLEGTRTKLKDRLHLFNDLQGPFTTYIPLYALALIPIKPINKIEMSEINLEDVAEKIKGMIASGKWEKIKADERVELMKQQKKITPPLPILPTKTSKAGYRELEFVEMESLRKLFEEWYKEHPGAKIFTEVKYDDPKNPPEDFKLLKKYGLGAITRKEFEEGLGKINQRRIRNANKKKTKMDRK